MMPLPLTPDSFWEYVFPRVEKLWPGRTQEAAGCAVLTVVLGQEMPPVLQGSCAIALSQLWGYRLLVLLFGWGDR